MKLNIWNPFPLLWTLLSNKTSGSVQRRNDGIRLYPPEIYQWEKGEIIPPPNPSTIFPVTAFIFMWGKIISKKMKSNSSFKFATGNDWWFHAKGQPGSHVIVKTNGEELPNRTFEEAGKLAAYYSRGRQAPKVEIDYTQKKNLRKPNGAKAGICSVLYQLLTPYRTGHFRAYPGAVRRLS